MITYKKVEKSYFKQYDQIRMNVIIESIFELEKINGGLEGILLKEVPVNKYVKDLSIYEKACEYESLFDISNWAFYMAFDGEKAIGGVTIASKTENMHMLEGRNDLSVVWDIRVDDDYKGQGVGTKLFTLAKEWSKEQGLKQMKVETQNNNVPACKFYRKQGAVIGCIKEYAYLEEDPNEIMILWYVNL